jgi:hypothetical protein
MHRAHVGGASPLRTCLWALLDWRDRRLERRSFSLSLRIDRPSSQVLLNLIEKQFPSVANANGHSPFFDSMLVQLFQCVLAWQVRPPV